jgi:sec-independent protein translocase protein TatA
VFTGLLQPTHLIILLVVALIFLGPKRLPDAGKALGQGLREFKSSLGGEREEDHRIPAQAAVASEEKAPTA